MAMNALTHRITLLVWLLILGACGQQETPPPAPETQGPSSVPLAPNPPRAGAPLPYLKQSYQGTRSTGRNLAAEEIGATVSYPQMGDLVLDSQIVDWIAARCPIGPESARAATPEGCMNQVLDACLSNALSLPPATPARCTFGASVEVVLNRWGLLSLKYTGNLYTGGAHGMPDIGYFNYDVESARILTLNDLIATPDELLDLLNQRMRSDYKLGDDQTLKDAGFLEDSLPLTENLLIEPQGLRFTWQAYAVAPYALGQPSVLLGYEQLAPVLAAGSPLQRIAAN